MSILTASVEKLINKLASEKILSYARQGNVEHDLMGWKDKLEEIKAVLDDAEEKKTTNGSVKKWLKELQGFAKKVEDLLDEFEFQNSRPSKFNFKEFNSTYRSRINSISSRFRAIVTEKNSLDLKES